MQNGVLKKKHKTWTWWDDKALQVSPPPPNKQTSPQIRFPGSRTPIKTYKTNKTKQTVFMFVGVNWNGKRKPFFNVKKCSKKRRREPDEGVRYNYKCFKIDANEYEKRLEKIVFPFMKKTKSTVALFNNSPCQSNKKCI